MNRRATGNILFMTLMFLLISTILVTMGIRLGMTHLRIVSNSQAHDEALGAAQLVIDQVLNQPVSATTDPIANPGAYPQTFQVDADKDGSNDYTVLLARPSCLGFREFDNSSVGYQTYAVQWDFQATVTDSRTGTQVITHQGVRELTKTADPCS
ncbi:pilus assembly PilX N-terminal domain-containing protein [Vogesella sp. GCM10023246]|uniref:Pilus assembly PilX N-terminal domain-containing protein n=1 Tax=Vogesella oryzagri TaxID=3160864 RepID=A0ABV1M3U9_9NEIS